MGFSLRLKGHDDICPGNICPLNICPYQKYLSCYWPDFDQTFNGTILNRFQLLLKKNVWKFVHATFVLVTFVHISNISAISQLLLVQFWPNFKCRFLGPLWTYSNCHNDICPGNICPCNICPYKEYLSCYWPNFDQTLKVGSWDHLKHISTVTGKKCFAKKKLQ